MSTYLIDQQVFCKVMDELNTVIYVYHVGGPLLNAKWWNFIWNSVLDYLAHVCHFLEQ